MDANDATLHAEIENHAEQLKVIKEILETYAQNFGRLDRKLIALQEKRNAKT